MNEKVIIAISITSLLLFSSVAFASVSSVTTSLSTTRATTGTSVTATVSVTATGSESGSIQLVCTPSGTSISDPASGSYQGVSLSTSPVSKTFTFTAGTANTYSCTGQSGGVSSTASTIVFVNPSALTISGTPSSKTVNASGTFTLSITIQNSQSDAVTTSYALTCSPHSCSGDPTSDTITVSGSSSTTLTWTVTAGSSSGTIKFKLGDNSNAFSSSVTVPAAAAAAGAAAEAGAGGAAAVAAKIKVTTEKGKATITIPSIAAGKSTTVDINKTEDVAISKITINVKNSVNNIQVIVAKFADKPASITQEVTGKVYHYIEINKTNITDAAINQTTVRFKVEKTWLDANNINDSTVALYRYSDNAWNKLGTTKIGELPDDTQNIYYDAVSPGLSVFAISGEAKAVAPAEQPPAEEKPAEEKREAPSVPTKGRGLLVTIIVLVVVAAGVVVFLVKKNVIKFDKLLPKKGSSWDELKKKYSKK